MAKKKNLRKQVAALEALVGLDALTPDQAKGANGGLTIKGKRRLKPKRGTGALLWRGTGALWGRRLTGALRWTGSGS